MKHPSLIAAGAATLLLVAYSLGMSATSARSQGDSLLIPITGKGWPPRVADTVVIDGVFQQSPNIFHKLYTVPANKWFVLTDIKVTPVLDHDLIQRLNQKERIKMNQHFYNADPRVEVGSQRVGLPFFPGSEIGLKTKRPGSSFTFYHLRGYLTSR